MTLTKPSTAHPATWMVYTIGLLKTVHLGQYLVLTGMNGDMDTVGSAISLAHQIPT